MSVRTSTTGPAPFLRTPTTPSLPTPVVTAGTRLRQLLGDPLRRFVLLVGKLGMSVEVLVEVERARAREPGTRCRRARSRWR